MTHNQEWNQSIETDPEATEMIKLSNKDTAAAAAKLLQLCPTLCDPRQQPTRLPGILQARTLEWVAISFSNAWKWKVEVKSLSRVRLLVIPWTAAYQAPPSMGFSRQEYWSGLPLPSPNQDTNSYNKYVLYDQETRRKYNHVKEQKERCYSHPEKASWD